MSTVVPVQRLISGPGFEALGGKSLVTSTLFALMHITPLVIVQVKVVVVPIARFSIAALGKASCPATTLPGPELVQRPDPTPGVFADKDEVAVQTLKSDPGMDVVGFSIMLKVTVVAGPSQLLTPSVSVT
jgi:hypothetical protein